MKGFLEGFRDVVMRGNGLDLAVEETVAEPREEIRLLTEIRYARDLISRGRP